MSYCEIILFKDGKPSDSVKYRNAWGGAVFIWNCLYNKYLKDPTKEYDSWLFGGGHKSEAPLWGLAKRIDIPMFMRTVHASTFDHAFIRREHFKGFTGHLRQFVLYFGSRDLACHLPAWADFIETCQHEAVGFRGTSVSENPWFSYDEAKDESIPYDLNTGDSHFEVFDWLESLGQPALTK